MGLQAPDLYIRARDLPRLVPLWPEEVCDETVEGRKRLVLRLGSALRCERQRGLAGSWTYHLARHRQLLVAYRAECRALQRERMRVKRLPDQSRNNTTD